jgi:hypothetical protein
LTHPEAVCRLLPPVLASTPPLLGWQGHQAAAGVLAAAACLEAVPLLEQHAEMIEARRKGDVAAIRKLVVDQPDIANVKDWQSSLDSSLAVLSAAKHKRGR